jgi:hypothetical protein
MHQQWEWLFMWFECLNNMVCILTLRMEKPVHTKISTYIRQVHQNVFYSQFQDYRHYRGTFVVLTSFVVNIKTVPQEFQLVIIVLNPWYINLMMLYFWHIAICFQCSDTMHNKEPVWRYSYFWTVTFKCE